MPRFQSSFLPQYDQADRPQEKPLETPHTAEETEDRQFLDVEQDKDYTRWESAVAAAKRHTFFGQEWEAIRRHVGGTPKGKSDEPFNIATLEDTKYWSYRENFIDCDTEGEALRKKGDIDLYLEMERAAAAHPLVSMGIILAANLPVYLATGNLVNIGLQPFMALTKLGVKATTKREVPKFFRRIGRHATLMGATAAWDERMLQEWAAILHDPLTTEESALRNTEAALTAGVILGGVSGTTVGLSKHAINVLKKKYHKMVEELGRYSRPWTTKKKQGTGAVVDVRPKITSPTHVETGEVVKIPRGATYDVDPYEWSEDAVQQLASLTGSDGMNLFSTMLLHFYVGLGFDIGGVYFKPLSSPFRRNFLSPYVEVQTAAVKLYNTAWHRHTDDPAFWSADIVSMAQQKKLNSAMTRILNIGYTAHARTAKSAEMSPLRKSEFYTEVYRAAFSKDIHQDNGVQNAAVELRTQILDPLLKLQQKYKILPEDISLGNAPSYIPIVFHGGKIQNNRGEWNKLIENIILQAQKQAEAELAVLRQQIASKEQKGVSTDALRARLPRLIAQAEPIGESEMIALVQNHTDSILSKHPLERSDTPTVEVLLRGSQKPRTITIPHEELMPYVYTDVEEVLRRYIRQTTIDLGLASRFGTHTSFLKTEDAKKIVQVYAEKSAKNPKKAAKIDRERDLVLEDFEAQWRRLRGVYNIPNQSLADRSIDIAIDTTRAWNVGRFLGLAGLRSTHDVAMVTTDVGIERVLGAGLYGRILDREAYNIRIKDAQYLGHMYSILRRSMIPRDGMAIADPINRLTKREKALGWVQDTAGHISGMTGMDNIRRQGTYMHEQQQMLRSCEMVASGKKVPGKVTRYLRKNGISDKTAIRFYEEYLKHGSVDEGGYMIANIHKWEWGREHEFANAIALAMHRMELNVREIETPLFQSTRMGRLSRQFTGWAQAATDKLLIAGAQDASLEWLQAVLLMWVIAVGEERLAEISKGVPEEKRMDARQLSTRALISTGIGGQLTFEADRIAPYVGGSLGYYTGTFSSKDHAPFPPAGATLGATLGASGGLPTDLFGTATKLMTKTGRENFTQKDTRAARRIFVSQNSVGISRLWDALENNINDYFQVPKSRRKKKDEGKNAKR